MDTSERIRGGVMISSVVGGCGGWGFNIETEEGTRRVDGGIFIPRDGPYGDEYALGWCKIAEGVRWTGGLREGPLEAI